VSYYFTAKQTADGKTYKSAVADSVIVKGTGVTPVVPGDGGSSGGCSAGFAGLALLLAAPLFLRRKDG
jgi:Synergist-CTERM protein sorting domain-containing protein